MQLTMAMNSHIFAMSDDLEAAENAAVQAAVWFLHQLENQNKRRQSIRKLQRKLPLRSDVSFSKVTSIYNDSEFARAFLMSRIAFRKLSALCGSKLMKNEEMGTRSGRRTISPEIRLAITIRMLAGASYLDLMTSYRIGASTVYSIFDDTSDVLMSVLQLPEIPSEYEKLHALAFKSCNWGKF